MAGKKKKKKKKEEAQITSNQFFWGVNNIYHLAKLAMMFQRKERKI
jgi:hypothetical protein